MHVGESLATVLANCAEHVRANLAGAKKGRDPENIHQLRVGLRRMRAALTIYRPVLASSARQAASEGLKQLEHQLAEARDWDVLIDAMNDSIWAGDLGPREVGKLLDGAESRRRKARALSSLAITQTDVAALLHRAQSLTRGGAARSSRLRGKLRPFAASILEGRDKKICKAGRHLRALQLHELHRFRIRLKKLRYACEFFVAIWLDPAAAAYIKRLKRMQQRLGDIHDTVSGCRLVRELSCEHSGLADDAKEAARWLKRQRKSERRRLVRPWRKFKRADRYWRSGALR